MLADMMPETRSVLVTGGAGFIGSHLADAFLEAGSRVTILDDPQTIVASCYAPRGLDEDEEGDEDAEGSGAEGAGAEVDGGTDDASSEE